MKDEGNRFSADGADDTDFSLANLFISAFSTFSMFSAVQKLSVIGLMGLLVGLVGCTAHPASTAPVLKVALVAPFEGNHRAVGYDAIYSARLAVRELNAQGGVAGQRVSLVALDDGGDPALAQAVAESLVQDTAVVAVIGHWRPETTTATQPIYAKANLPFIPLGQVPLEPYPAEQLPPTFVANYEAVTPFDETAGIYAGPTYDAVSLIFAALEAIPTATRTNLHKQLPNQQIDGITGTVYQP